VSLRRILFFLALLLLVVGLIRVLAGNLLGGAITLAFAGLLGYLAANEPHRARLHSLLRFVGKRLTRRDK
jgi:hypothetical protein